MLNVVSGFTFVSNYVHSTIKGYKYIDNLKLNFHFKIKRFGEMVKYLERTKLLHVYGFNSESYDIPVLFAGLLEYAKSCKFPINVIKRGNKFMTVQIENIIFCDVLNFTSGCSLDSFARMWGSTQSKAIFPYEKYTSIIQLETDTTWPSMIDFKSTLKNSNNETTMDELKDNFKNIASVLKISEAEFVRKLSMTTTANQLEDLLSQTFPVSISAYVDTWKYFEEEKTNGFMTNMADYLKHYNSLDTEVLCDAFKNYIHSFIDNFGVNPNDFCSLPGIAETVLWKYYDSSKYVAYSFNERYSFVYELIREKLSGGLSTVFQRHVEIGKEEDLPYSKSVTHAGNNLPFKHLLSVDVNSKLLQKIKFFHLLLYILYK